MPEPDDDSSAAATVTYELRLTGGGVAVERQVSEAQALQIVSLVMGGEPAPRAASTAPPSSRATHRGSLATTVGEYLDEVEAKRNPDKIVAIGAFLVDHLGKESSTREEVKPRSTDSHRMTASLGLPARPGGRRVGACALPPAGRRA